MSSTIDLIRDIIQRSRAYYCLDCGKCTGVCPVARVNHDFSPRSILMRTVQKDYEAILQEKSIWECLTCGMCEQWCPAGIQYIRFIRDIRALAIGHGQEAECSHDGALQSLMRMMTAPELKQNRMEWITPKEKISKTGDIFYFVGCAPFFDSFFEDLNVKTLDSARGVIQILNKVGIKPVVSPDERCCGHDLLWAGDVDNFRKLAEHNVQVIEKSGAKKVVFSCPEGYQTFKQDYPEYVGPLKFDIAHISEFIAPYVESKEITLPAIDQDVTFHDPCRLGRHLGVYDAPRQILKSIPKLNFVEMNHSRHRSVCCGVGNWLTCGAYTKMIQEKRLTEAQATGAHLVITSCPKCEIHLKCALSDKKLSEKVNVEVQDLISLITHAES